MTEKPTTIQQTAKKYKVAQLVGVVLIMIGVVSCMAVSSVGETPVTGNILGLVGIALYTYGRFAAWWHHG